MMVTVPTMPITPLYCAAGGLGGSGDRYSQDMASVFRDPHIRRECSGHGGAGVGQYGAAKTRSKWSRVAAGGMGGAAWGAAGITMRQSQRATKREQADVAASSIESERRHRKQQPEMRGKRAATRWQRMTHH